MGKPQRKLIFAHFAVIFPRPCPFHWSLNLQGGVVYVRLIYIVALYSYTVKVFDSNGTQVESSASVKAGMTARIYDDNTFVAQYYIK